MCTKNNAVTKLRRSLAEKIKYNKIKNSNEGKIRMGEETRS